MGQRRTTKFRKRLFRPLNRSADVRRAMRENTVTITWDVTRVNKYGMPVEFACPRDGLGSDGRPGPRPPLGTVLYVRHTGRVATGPDRALRFVERFVPSRVAREEIGDSTEAIQRVLDDPAMRCVRLRVYWMVFRTGVVAILNSIRYLAKRALGRKTD